MNRNGRPRSRRQETTKTPPLGPVLLPHETGGLEPAQYVFALALTRNGFNAKAAYLTAHPGVTAGSAEVQGHHTLSNPKVRAFLATRLEEAWGPLEVAAVEAIGRLGRMARADITLLFDNQGRLLRPHQWPEQLRTCVKRYRAKDGEVTLESPLAALRLVLELTGRLKDARTEKTDELGDAIKRMMAERGSQRD
jgi:phage terminase small subunit